MEVDKYDDLVMDFQNLMSCIQCHEDSTNVSVISETLKIIVDICTTEACGKDAFREEGGLEFLINLVSTTDSTLLVEHLLKTLALIIDENVQSQIHMSRHEVFQVLQAVIRKPFPNTVIKNALLLTSSILFQNSLAQNISLEIGFIQDLINMFEYVAPFCSINDNSNESSTEIWININSALCFAVNNPQNEKIQDACAVLFPLSLKLLESSSDNTVCCAVASFLSLCIASNAKNQDKFSECDGLLILKRSFQKLLNSIELDLKEFKRVVKKGTLQFLNNLIGVINAVVSEHDKNAELLGQLGMLSLMMKCLSAEILDIQLQTRIILALANCIDVNQNCKSFILQFPKFDDYLKRNFQLRDQELISATKYLLQVCLNNEGTYLNTDTHLVEDNHSFTFPSVSERCYANAKSSSNSPKLSVRNMDHAKSLPPLRSSKEISDIKQNSKSFSFLTPFSARHPNDISLDLNNDQNHEPLLNHFGHTSQDYNLNLLTKPNLHNHQLMFNHASSHLKTESDIDTCSSSYKFNPVNDTDINNKRNNTVKSVSSFTCPVRPHNGKNINHQELNSLFSEQCKFKNISECDKSVSLNPNVCPENKFSIPLKEFKCLQNEYSQLKSHNNSGTEKFNFDHAIFIDNNDKSFNNNISDILDHDIFLRTARQNPQSNITYNSKQGFESFSKITNSKKKKKFIFNNLKEKIKRSDVSMYSEKHPLHESEEQMMYPDFFSENSKGLFNFTSRNISIDLENDLYPNKKNRNKRTRNNGKKYRNSEKENQLIFPNKNANFIQNSENLMEVIVLPGESCEYHKLISSFEMLKVMSLE